VNTHEAKRCLEAGLEAVLEAGPIALEYFRQPMAVRDKRSGGHYDPVTEADRRIELLIRERLRRNFPDHRVVGEEHGSEGAGTTCWYIDPIDGTRAFISGMPTWGILLGLVVEDRPLVGIVHQPYTGETWYAAPGVGARLRVGERESALRTRAHAELADAVLYSTHPSMFREPALLERYERLAAARPELDRKLEAVRAMGSRKFFLRSTAGSLSAAEVQERVRQLVEGSGGRLISVQVGQPRVDGLFRQVTVTVQLNANILALRRILLAAETAEPYVFVDALTVRAQVPPGYKVQPGFEPEMFIQLDISGFAIAG